MRNAVGFGTKVVGIINAIALTTEFVIDDTRSLRSACSPAHPKPIQPSCARGYLIRGVPLPIRLIPSRFRRFHLTCEVRWRSSFRRCDESFTYPVNCDGRTAELNAA